MSDLHTQDAKQADRGRWRPPWGTAAAVVLAAFVLSGWVVCVIETMEGWR
jgi:hypothetical protein